MAEVEVSPEMGPQETAVAPEPETAPVASSGTILEAAFVDPAYTWPPADGQGTNAIELQAAQALMRGEDDESTTATDREAMEMPNKPRGMFGGALRCCRTADMDVVKDYEKSRDAANEARTDYKNKKSDKARAKRKAERYTRVPEGILIYKLDTSNQTIELMSAPSGKTEKAKLVENMVVASCSPSNDATRRGIDLVGTDGTKATLVACEQRTAIAWMESMDMMLANKERSAASGRNKKTLAGQTSRAWGKEQLNEAERDQIEEQYVNLAAHSNKLIRAGAIPGAQEGGKDKNNKSKSRGIGGGSGAAGGVGGAGGIYYSVDVASGKGDEYEGEALESIAKRRAVIKDSWDFYRMICSLLRDRRKYDEVFRKMQLDPVYPYLNSMTGLNDPGDDGVENLEKEVMQPSLPEDGALTKSQLANAMIKKAEEALPSLVEICKALAGSLGMEEVGVGPIKELDSAIRKADRKYDGDLLKVTDYCRALLVVKDFPSLLALLELARDSFGPLIRRVKLSTLKSDHKSLQGGYRDCKINLELKDHICEIQVHIWPMWTVCGVDGFRHYRHCLEYATDSFDDPYDALEGLDRKTMAELIVMAEEAVAETPLDSLEWYQEKYILDYFAEVGLFMKHGLDVWAETTLRHLIKLRSESPDIGADHHETFILQRYLEQVLRRQKKNREADEVSKKIEKAKKRIVKEEKAEEADFWDAFYNAPTDAYDMIVDPNKKEREEEEKLRKDVKQAKKYWRKLRQERFSFLDSAQHADVSKM